jgi:opacity protein-like surface antigen
MKLNTCYNTYMMRKTLITAVAAIATAASAQAALVDTPESLQETFDMMTEHVGVEARLFVITDQARNEYPVLKDMPRSAIGYATRTASGQCFVFVHEDIADRFQGHVTLEHEYAHCVSWNEYGEDIASHGREFKAACQSFSTNYNSCKDVY